MRDAEGRVLFYEGTLTDITAAHELSQQLSYDASHDPLTGLVNRREFELRLQRALEMTQATGATHAVCFLDLDRFKTINDAAGHLAGDDLLQQIGQLLQHKVRANDVVARLGGDEFALLLHSCGPSDAIQVANNLLKAVDRHQFIWAANTYDVGVSIGLVADQQQLQADRAGNERGRHGLLRGQGRGPRAPVRLPGRRLAGCPPRTVKWSGSRGPSARSTENRLYLDVQTIMPLAAAADAPHYELLVRMRDEVGPHRAARRVPACRRAPQPVGALRPLGIRRRRALAAKE